jgi:hypothetical protein
MFWLSFPLGDSVWDGAMKGAVRGAIIGGVAGALIYVIGQFRKKDNDNQKK